MFIIYNDECNLYCTLFHSVILFIQIKYAIYCLHRHNLCSGNYNIKINGKMDDVVMISCELFDIRKFS